MYKTSIVCNAYFWALQLGNITLHVSPLVKEHCELLVLHSYPDPDEEDAAPAIPANIDSTASPRVKYLPSF